MKHEETIVRFVPYVQTKPFSLIDQIINFFTFPSFVFALSFLANQSLESNLSP